jgi:hypothetical protein
MPRRPCLGCGTPTTMARCSSCRREHERRRGTRQQRGYDATYDKARAALHLELRPPCHWGCGRVATTADHDPPMHEVGVHYRLVPACAQCNYPHRSARERNASDER